MSLLDTLSDELKKECSSFGISMVEDDVIDKMCELCLANRLNAEDLMSSWLAFASSKALTNSKPTLDLLDQLYREEICKSNTRVKVEPVEETIKIDEEDSIEINEVGDELLLAYGTPIVKAQALKRQHTPTNIVNKRRHGSIQSPALISPTIYSPEMTSTPSSSYGSRNNSGDVMFSFGDTSNSNWQGNASDVPLIIKHYDAISSLTKKFEYMYEKVSSKARIQNQWLEDMQLQLTKIRQLTFSTPLLTSEKQVIIGRVWSDGLGKLNVNQLQIEVLLEDNNTSYILLDVSGLQHYSFFPGQIVAIEGIISRDRFLAEKMYGGALLPFSSHVGNENIQKSLEIVVACGPFSTSDEGTYNPLIDLLNYVEKNQPDVCILIGPFIDSKCDAYIKSCFVENSDFRTYDEIFDSLLDIIHEKIQSLKTQVIIIPSHRDLHHSHFVYPTPPFDIHFSKKGINFMSDPCTLIVNGVVIGVTSVDILFHLGREEISSPGSTDRLTRFVRHLLLQQNYYPLSPPHEDVNIDYRHFDMHGSLPVTPDILILPSDLKHFIKNVEGCCCINPVRLVKGVYGGSFSRIHVDCNKRIAGSSIIDSIKAEIIKI